MQMTAGVEMPLIGLGTWTLRGNALATSLTEALAVGYRLIDTASYYSNEETIGVVLKNAGLPRDSYFVTTKIRGRDQGRQRTPRALERSLRRLQLDFVDLLLIHWPLPMRDVYVETWERLIELRDRGLARAIGVSNFNPIHIERIIAATGVAPSVNQIQCNPAVQNADMRTHNTLRGVHTQSWEPLGLRSGVLQHPLVTKVADELDRSSAQVVLRWHIQNGMSAVPKTSTTSRLSENLDVFGWRLSRAHLHQLNCIDQGDTDRVNPETNLVE